MVQDVITGIFILLENAVSVRDVVTVAKISGLVEDLSIRSIRLRDLSGNVDNIPFSSVDTVTNMTKEYSYYLIDIGVAYREDTDQVAAVCKRIAEEMRSDPEFGPEILEPQEVLGVDRFDDSAVVIKARIKTRPIKQWMVGLEFKVTELGRYVYALCAWLVWFKSWRRDLDKRLDAGQDVAVDLRTGAALIKETLALVSDVQHLKAMRVTVDPHQFPAEMAEIVHMDPRSPCKYAGLLVG